MTSLLRRIAALLGRHRAQPANGGPRSFAAILERCVRESDPVTLRVATLQRSLSLQPFDVPAGAPAQPNERN